MRCYRVARRPYADLSGEGAGRFGGRFNPPGIPAVYASQSISLAMLEILVHVEKSEIPSDYVVMAIKVSGVRVSRSPAKLREARKLEVDLYRAKHYGHPIHRVPSVIVPREYNYVFLPEAAGFDATVEWVEPLQFDRRLFTDLGV